MIIHSTILRRGEAEGMGSFPRSILNPDRPMVHSRRAKLCNASPWPSTDGHEVILTRLRLVKVLPAIDGRIVIQSPSGLVRTVVVIPVELRPPTIFHVTDGSESRISALTIEIDPI